MVISKNLKSHCEWSRPESFRDRKNEAIYKYSAT